MVFPCKDESTYDSRVQSEFLAAELVGEGTGIDTSDRQSGSSHQMVLQWFNLNSSESEHQPNGN